MSTPLCPYFNKCGGCSAQHIDYQLQLENKKKLIQRITKVTDVKVFSDQPYSYRNRMDFVFSPGGIGLREQGTKFQIIGIDKCVISEPSLNILLTEVQQFFQHIDAFTQSKQQGTYRYAIIRTTTTGDSAISFLLNEDSPQLPKAIEKIKLFAQQTTAKNIIIAVLPKNSDNSTSEDIIVIKGNDYLTQTLCNKQFRYSSQGFFQNNTNMAEKMQQYVHTLLQTYPTKTAHLLDLYAGVGTFGIINAPLFKSVSIVESYPVSIELAATNLQLNNITNAQTHVLDAKHLSRLTFPTPLYIILDPPRIGMDQKTIQTLKTLHPQVIIYISCNPEQLAKDVPKFSNYEIKSAALFDLFPQTNHTEVIVELIKKS